MNILSRIATVVLSGAVLLGTTAAAWSASTVEGIVKDAKGQPLSGAVIRIEGDRGLIARIKTDNRGHYSQGSLGAGTYRVGLIVNGEIKAVISNVTPQEGEVEKLNFSLERAAFRPSSKGKHFVLVRNATGTHTEAWVEVDDQRKMSLGMQERTHDAAGRMAKSWQDAASGMRNQ
jgi:Carboxypeptidase regulatory-like domain